MGLSVIYWFENCDDAGHLATAKILIAFYNKILNW